MREVTKQVFYDFVEKYPKTLNNDVVHICDPPLLAFNDFNLENPIVCKIVLNSARGGNDTYFITEKQEE